MGFFNSSRRDLISLNAFWGLRKGRTNNVSPLSLSGQSLSIIVGTIKSSILKRKGSSYISGHKGCIAITSASDLTQRNDSNGSTCSVESAAEDAVCSQHYSGKVFSSTVMKAGNESMPTHNGKSTMTGNSGNGYVKITVLGSN